MVECCTRIEDGTSIQAKAEMEIEKI